MPRTQGQQNCYKNVIQFLDFSVELYGHILNLKDFSGFFRMCVEGHPYWTVRSAKSSPASKCEKFLFSRLVLILLRSFPRGSPSVFKTSGVDAKRMV